MPSVFDAKMTELPPITHLNQERPVQKVVHLRDNTIFLVVYNYGLLQVVNFNATESEEGLIDEF